MNATETQTRSEAFSRWLWLNRDRFATAHGLLLMVFGFLAGFSFKPMYEADLTPLWAVLALFVVLAWVTDIATKWGR